MKLQITDIEFDLSDDCGEYIDTELLQDQLQNVYIGQFWDVNEEDELVDLISDKSGWCVNSINYKQIKWLFLRNNSTNSLRTTFPLL